MSSPDGAGHLEFKFNLLKVRIRACLLSHRSLGIHVIWVELTLIRDGT